MFLKDILTGGVKEVISTIGDVIDDSTYSKEERAIDDNKAQELANQFELRRSELDNEELRYSLENEYKNNNLAFENTKSSRVREVEITNSNNSSWFQKNINPLIALFVITFTFVIWSLILFRNYEPKSNESIIIGALSTITMTIINYYFGSSLSSSKKDDTINKQILNNK